MGRSPQRNELHLAILAGPHIHPLKCPNPQINYRHVSAYKICPGRNGFSCAEPWSESAEPIRQRGRSFDCRAGDGASVATGNRRSASSLHTADQLSRKVAWLSMARPVRVFRDGRTLFARDGTLRRIESCSSPLGGGRCRLAFQQCQSTLVGRGRLLGRDGPAVGDHRRLAGLSRQRHPRKTTRSDTRSWTDWPAVGRHDIPSAFGGNHWSHPCPKEAWSQTEIP